MNTGLPKIFISYRRSDSGGYTGRLYDALKSYFGEDHIFKDLESIAIGADFLDVIQKAITESDIILVVIGPEWIGTNENQPHRLFQEDDVVRLEIVEALKSRKRLIPVLVGNASMPNPQQLPTELQSLLLRNAHELSDRRWHEDLNRLVEAISGKTATTASKRKLALLTIKPIVGALLLLAIPLTEWLTGLRLNRGIVVFVSSIAALLCLLTLFHTRETRTLDKTVAWISVFFAGLFVSTAFMS